jgi:hypothetical protein
MTKVVCTDSTARGALHDIAKAEISITGHRFAASWDGQGNGLPADNRRRDSPGTRIKSFSAEDYVHVPLYVAVTCRIGKWTHWIAPASGSYRLRFKIVKCRLRALWQDDVDQLLDHTRKSIDLLMIGRAAHSIQRTSISSFAIITQLVDCRM